MLNGSTSARRVLRVAFPRVFPAVSWTRCSVFPTLRPTGTCPYPGLVIELIALFAQSLNVEIEPFVFSETEEDRLVTNVVNGTPYGFLKLLHNNTVDLIAVSFQLTKARTDIFDFSEPMYTVPTYLLTHETPRLSENIWGFFRAYNASTWEAILAALLVQILVCVLMRRVEECMPGRHRASGRRVGLAEMLRLQLMQPEKIHFGSAAGRLSVMLFSLVQCAVLLGVFSSWILTSIIRDAQGRLPFDSMDAFIRLLGARQLSLVSAQPNFWFFEEVNRSEVFPYPQLRAALARNPLRVLPTAREALEVVMQEGAVTFMQSDDETAYMAAKFCGLTATHQDMPMLPAHLAFRRRFPLAAAFNASIRENRMFIDRLVRKYEQFQQRERRACPPAGLHSPLGPVPYLGLFVLCLAAVLAAGLALGLELLTWRCSRPA